LLPLQIFIYNCDDRLLPVINAISGGAPDYIHVPRWETLVFHATVLFRDGDGSGFKNLISQPMPSLKHLTLKQTKLDFHAFPSASNLEELNIIYNRCSLIGRSDSFPNLKRLHVTYPSKYPLCSMYLSKFSLRTMETLIIGGYVDIGNQVKGTYPSLSRLEFSDRVLGGIVYMSAPFLRHLVLRTPVLFCPTLGTQSQELDSLPKNREVLEMLGKTFPTVEVLEVHSDLQDLVEEMISDKVIFVGLKELRILSQDEARSGTLWN